MADMFGTIGGMFASQEHRRAERAADLEALKTMSEISSQPIKNQLNQAQAEQYRASAGHLEAETARLKTEQEAQEKLAAIAQLVAEKHAAGEIPTTEDLSDGQPKSLADPFQAQLELAQREGISPIITDKLATTIAGIRQKEAQAAASRATQQLNQMKMMKERLAARGSFAAAALQAGPGQWAQMRQMAVDRTPPGQPSELDKLPQDWNAARPILQAALNESVDGAKHLELAETRIQNEAQRARMRSSNAKDVAAVELAKKRGVFIEARAEQLKKNGGGASPEAKRAQEEMALSRRAIREAKDRKEFPRAPLDKKERVVGQTYTGANGAKYLWDHNPATGEGAWIELAPPPGTRAAARVTESEPRRSRAPVVSEDYDLLDDAED